MTFTRLHGRHSKVLVNIPILNEIDNIEKLVAGVCSALHGYDYVLLIVDDGSKDGTLEYLQEIMPAHQGRITVLNHRKTGSGCQRGSALLAGLEWGLSKGKFDIFVEMDGDLSHRPEELQRGIDVIASGASDIAIVSKYSEDSKITGRSVGRTVISLICNFAVRTAIRWTIRDFSNGYRFYSRSAAMLVSQHVIRYGGPIYLTEVMALWLKHGLRVVEIPGHYVGRNEGLSKVRPLDYIQAAIGVVEIAVRFHWNRFRRVSEKDSTLSVTPSRNAKAAAARERDG